MFDLFDAKECQRLESAGFVDHTPLGTSFRLWRCPDGSVVSHEEALARLQAADINAIDTEGGS